MSTSTKVAGAVLLIATAVLFELELGWAFLAAAVLLLGWIGFALAAP